MREIFLQKVTVREFCDLLDLFHDGISTTFCSYWLAIIQFLRETVIRECDAAIQRKAESSEIDFGRINRIRVIFEKIKKGQVLTQKEEDTLKPYFPGGPSSLDLVMALSPEWSEDFALKIEQTKLAVKPVDQVLQELGLEEKPVSKKKLRVKKSAAKKKAAEPKKAATIIKNESPPKPVELKKAAAVVKPVEVKVSKPAAAVEIKPLPAVVEEKKKEPVLIDDGLCVICLTAPATHLTLECGHLSYCEGCVKTLKICCICRAPIVRAIKVFKT
jgi:hypothetical protein